MTREDPNSMQIIDRVHSAAICTEIGERLFDAFARNRTQLPPRLVGLAKMLDAAVSGDVVLDDLNRIELG